MGTELGRLGNYRVGDAERSRTVELLKEAHVAGYLTLADIDERLSAALAARTRDDLERQLADLPPEWRSRQVPQPAVPQPAVPRGRAGAPVLMHLLPLVVLVVLVAVVVLAVTRGFFFPWPLLWVWFVFGRWHRRGGWNGRDSNRVTWM